MAEISKLKFDNVVYDIKDATARQAISGCIKILGETSTALTDNATTNPITINNDSVTAVANDAVFYDSKEFVFDGTYWHEFGDMTGLGDLAQHDLSDIEFETTVSSQTASTTVATSSTETAVVAPAQTGEATYTPAGTIGNVAIGVATSETWDNLAVSYGGTTGTDAETLIFTTTSKEAAKTVEVTTQPTWTGTGVRLEGTVSVPATFTTTVDQATATTTADYAS